MIKIERKSLTWEVVLPLMVASVTNMRYGIVNSEVLLMRFMQKKQSCNCYSCKKNHAIVPSSKCVVMWMVLYVNWGGSEASPFLVTFNLHIIQVTKRWQRPLARVAQIVAAWLRESEERMRKWRGNGEKEWGNGERMRKWRKNEEMGREWGKHFCRECHKHGEYYPPCSAAR